jgi:hypothetical protein
MLDELRHRSHHILNRHLPIESVALVEIDRLNAQPFQTPLTSFTYIPRFIVDRPPST